MNDSIQSIIENEPEITHYTPRLEYFTLTSSLEITKGAMIIGVNPESENKLSR